MVDKYHTINVTRKTNLKNNERMRKEKRGEGMGKSGGRERDTLQIRRPANICEMKQNKLINLGNNPK